MSETRSLTSEQLIEWLHQNNVPQEYCVKGEGVCRICNWMEIFRNKGITGKTILKLDNSEWNNELGDLGVEPFGIRKKLWGKICHLKEVSKDEETPTTDEEFEAVPRSTVSQLSWLPEGEQLHRLRFKRAPKEFREALKSSPQLTKELSSGAFVFVPMPARDYVERLVAKGNEDVANLDGKDVIASSSLVDHVKEVVANAEGKKTKLNGITLITTNAFNLTPQPSAAAPNLSKDTPGKRVETIKKTFIHVRPPVSACAASIASSSDIHLGKDRNPRRKCLESQAFGALDDEDVILPEVQRSQQDAIPVR